MNLETDDDLSPSTAQGAPPANAIETDEDLMRPESTPARAPGAMPGIGQALLQGATESMRDVGATAETLGGQRPQAETQQSAAAAPLAWSDVGHPIAQLAPKLAYRLGKSSPTLAAGTAGAAIGAGTAGPVGGLLGGAGGAALGTAASELGPAFRDELAKSPRDPDGAWDRAIKRTAISSVASGASWAAFPMKMLNGPIKNAVFQTFGVQPAIGVAGQAATKAVEGDSPLEGIGQAYTEGVLGTALPAVTHGVTRGARTDPVRPMPESTDVLEAKAKAGFDAAHSSGMRFSDQMGQDMGAEWQQRAAKEGIDPRDYPQVWKQMTRLQSNPMASMVGSAKDATTISDLHNVRQNLGDYLGASDPQTRRAAGVARGIVDRYLLDGNKLDQYDVTQSGQGQAVANQLGTSIDEYARAKVMRTLEGIQDKAGNARNYNTSLQNSVRTILNSPKQSAKLGVDKYPGMREALQGIISDQPGAISRFVDRVADFSPLSGHGAMHAGIGLELLHSLGLGHPLSMLLPLAGLTASGLKGMRTPRGPTGIQSAIEAAGWGKQGGPPGPGRAAYRIGPTVGLRPTQQQFAEGGGVKPQDPQEAYFDAIAPRYKGFADAPRLAPDKEHATSIARAIWEKHGSEKDFHELPQSLYQREGKEWNKTHPDDQIDPDNISLDHPFMHMIDEKYLKGQKSKFRGLNSANETHMENGNYQHMVFDRKVPKDLRADLLSEWDFYKPTPPKAVDADALAPHYQGRADMPRVAKTKEDARAVSKQLWHQNAPSPMFHEIPVNLADQERKEWFESHPKPTMQHSWQEPHTPEFEQAMEEKYKDIPAPYPGLRFANDHFVEHAPQHQVFVGDVPNYYKKLAAKPPGAGVFAPDTQTSEEPTFAAGGKVRSLLHAAGAVLATRDGQALFLRRAGHKTDHKGTWCWPGGGIDAGETPKEAMIREVREETHWIKPEELETTPREGTRHTGFVTFVWHVGSPFIPELNEEHDAWCWAPLDHPPQPLHPGVTATIGRLRAMVDQKHPANKKKQA